MARFILIEALPWRVTDGVAVATRLAGGGRRAYNHRGFNDWRSGITTDPKFVAALGYGAGGWTGGAIPTAAQIDFFPTDQALIASLADDYLWIGAAIEIRSGDDDLVTPTYVMELTGTVASISAADGRISFTVTDLGKKLDDPVVKARFAGTGGIEGVTEAEGRAKRRSWGVVRNVEGLVLDKANNIYEFGDLAFPLNSFDLVSDIGRNGTLATLAWQGSIAATFTALQAASPPSGGGTVAPSIACVKWWTIPNGPLTADIQGEVGSGYVNKPADIASRVSAAISGPTFESTSFATVNGARTAPVGVHVGDDSESAGSVLDRLLLPLNVGWTLEPAGTIRLSEIKLTGSVETIPIQDVERLETYRPVGTVKLGYRKNHRVHSGSEISAAILLSAITDAGTLASLNAVDFATQVTGAAKPANNATVGAVAGTNLRSSTSAVLGDAQVMNSAVTIGSNGALSGAGGGAVTYTGLGGGPVGLLSAVAAANMVTDGGVNLGTIVPGALNTGSTATQSGTSTLFVSASGPNTTAVLCTTAAVTINDPNDTVLINASCNVTSGTARGALYVQRSVNGGAWVDYGTMLSFGTGGVTSGVKIFPVTAGAIAEHTGHTAGQTLAFRIQQRQDGQQSLGDGTAGVTNYACTSGTISCRRFFSK